MLTLNANFKAALRRNPNTPSFIAKFVRSELYAEKTSQTDWLAYKQAVSVDLTTEPGSVLIPKITPSGITQTAQNSTLCFGSATSIPAGAAVQSPAVPGTDSFAWQSFKQTSGQNRYVDKVSVHLYATGALDGWANYWNYFYIQLFDAKNGAAISTQKVIGGSQYTVDELVSLDFSGETILMTSGTTYWVKVYAVSIAQSYQFGSTASAASYVRYQNSSVYADGQMDGKPYTTTETTNIGDMAFTVSFLNSYAYQGFITEQLDLGAAPTVDGEWRIDKLTPLNSSVSIRAQAYDSVDSVAQTTSGTGAGNVWMGLADNGSRMVRVSLTSPYIQYSDDRGLTWNAVSGSVGPSGAVCWSGSRFVSLGSGSISTWYSVDGITWSAGGNLPVSATWKYCLWTGTTLIAIPSVGQYGATSTDGGTWTQQTLAAASHTWLAAGYGNNVALLIDSLTNTYASDATGVTWSAKASMPYGVTWVTLTYGNGKFVALATGTTVYAYTTDGGTSWQNGSHGANSPVTSAAAYNGNLFVGAGSSNFYYSADGISGWTYMTGQAGCNGIIAIDGQFVGTRVSGANSDGILFFKHPGHTELGLVVDAQAITTLKRYYSFTAFLSPDTTGSWTPSLRSVQAYFPTWLTLSTTPEKGHEASISTVSSLQTSIDTFKPSTVGQITLGLALTKNVSNYLKTNYPRNKEVRIYAGFADLAEADYVDYYRGNIEDWSFGQSRLVSISLRDFNKGWKGVPVPKTWTVAGGPGAGDDLIYTAQHPVDVMLDIKQGYIGEPTKATEGDSFATVKAALAGWVVTNTLTGKTFDAKDLMEELRFVTGTYFIPRPDGRQKLKRWDKNEASVMDLTDAEMIDVAYKGNSTSLMNLLNWYFNMTTEGVGKAGGIALHQEQDGASQFNWGEKKTFEFKDYWTLTAQEVAQVYPVTGAILERYAAVPDVLSFSLDLRFIELELADMVAITTKIAPSADLAGISGVKYQITRKDLDFQKSRIKLEVLRAA